ncbi:MAG: HD domain-containing protein [Thermogemmatispora sp.]|uniref:HD domain-containing protein n=1 Tax=Thermogemmatispora sp. TaxID=1968838 RepID=UPI00261A1120|nr:HD domain-containing protein [Thermogemmatispora sp.]MBX5459423.1 HD domain-containing protein [Thermogemmatispora sp.]
MAFAFDRDAVLAQVYREVEGRFLSVGRADLAHGWDHIERVYRLAVAIAQREGADQFVVGMAALLHDLGRVATESERDGKMSAAQEQRHHADLSHDLAAEVLAAHGVPTAEREAILHAVLAHSFSRGIEPRTLEARVVRDADRLDGLGAIGIMRWAITGTLRAAAETRPYDPADPFAEQHAPDDRRYLLDHFYTKLLRMGETMGTATGQALAQERLAFMRRYLEEFRRELRLEGLPG